MTSMSELRKKVFEDTAVDHLSPINIARDRALRQRYEAWLARRKADQRGRSHVAGVRGLRPQGIPVRDVRPQRRLALEAMQAHWLVLGRLKTVLLEQDSYAVEALEESLTRIEVELCFSGTRLLEATNTLVCARRGIFYGPESK